MPRDRKKAKTTVIEKAKTPTPTDEYVAENDVDENDVEDAENVEDEVDEEEPRYVAPQAKERYEYTPTVQATIVYVHENCRVTSEVMSLFEFTECVAQRAKQLENDTRIRFTDTTGLTDYISMAKKELADKRCPLAIRRQLHDNIYELWRTSEMIVPWL